MVTEKMNSAHISMLETCELLHGVSKSDMPEALSWLDARLESYKKGETIIRMGSFVEAGVMLNGEARLSQINEDSSIVYVDHVIGGEMFGQSAACLAGYKSQTELEAKSDARICRLDLNKVLEFSGGGQTSQEYRYIIASNLIKSIAKQNTKLNLRMHTIGQKTIRGRLKVYLNELTQGSTEWFTIPFSMSDLAVFLNSDRSALYKEIRLLKSEGVLDWSGRRVRLLKSDF